jgi:UDP-N-acetylglucosamine:LPS N-acetylglucosamine transferase
MNPKHRTSVLAVASGGGHWIQLMRLRPALNDCDCTYVTVNPENRVDVPDSRFYCIPDANRSTKLRLLGLCFRLLYIIFRERPAAIISTGAAPGYLAIRIGRALGARGLFIDSIANAERLSLSGQLASHHADLMLTQWPELAGGQAVQYRGAVLPLPDDRPLRESP